MPLLSPGNFSAPQILAAEKDYLVVFKPPRMHSAPQAGSADKTLLDCCAGEFPEISALPGRRAGEGGLLHRLDYETQGLMILARTVTGMESLLAQQKKGAIIKGYSALASESKIEVPGFPAAKPAFPPPPMKQFKIESAFRPYGRGRKEVRPIKEGKPYVTEILDFKPVTPEIVFFLLGITNGFRHQIRNHLAWLGLPTLNDSLYGGVSYGKGFLALRASSLSFFDPASGKELAYSISPLELDLL